MTLTYRDAGVDTERAQTLVKRISVYAEKTRRPGVISKLGGFAGLFRMHDLHYENPVLLTTTDGVGTKLLLARQLADYSQIGIDLVAMCANDVLAGGGEPLLFLDYIACGKLSPRTLEIMISGMAEGCERAGCALTGGETAELPGMYEADSSDLAGFMVGVVEEKHLLGAHRVETGDLVIGLASNGVHANGFSLVRKVLEVSGADLNDPFGENTLGSELLKATSIYVKDLLPLVPGGGLHALSHITGGGITENLPRVLQDGQAARISTDAWPRPEIFNWLQKAGDISEDEMLRVFNCGVGMIAIVSRDAQELVMSSLSRTPAWVIGEIVRHDGSAQVFFE